jgi:hypothetical protein
MSDMNPNAVRSPADPYIRHPREIAAAVTLRAAAAALVAPGGRPSSAAGCAAIRAACGALATRMALIRFVAQPSPPAASDDRPPDVVRIDSGPIDSGPFDVRPVDIVPFDPFHDPTPPALHGAGPTPDRDRLRVAGDRCVAVWHAWTAEGSPRDERIAVAGALALGAWCSWALGSAARAEVRARYALDTVPDDALAGLVLRTVLARSGPAWRDDPTG